MRARFRAAPSLALLPPTARLTARAGRRCSPTRRSFLSGRFPIHITGSQAPTCSNFLPIQMTLLPAKLKTADYEVRSTLSLQRSSEHALRLLPGRLTPPPRCQTHMIGKGHLSVPEYSSPCRPFFCC